MDAGRIVEVGDPNELKAKPGGFFRGLYEQLNASLESQSTVPPFASSFEGATANENEEEEKENRNVEANDEHDTSQ